MKEKLEAFISLLYTHRAYEAKIRISHICGIKIEDPFFFKNNESKWFYDEIMKYLQFDKKSERSQSLQIKKFAMISTMLNQLSENSQCCYKPEVFIPVDEELQPSKTGFRVTHYMPNKPDKFGIKF